MIKTYTANSHISINVVLPNKSNMHVSFVPLSDGRSMYSTNDENVQRGLERHYNFNKLFFLSESEEQNEAESETAKDDTIDDGANDDGLLVVEVSDLAEAKNYLADKFGLSRTKLNSSAKIINEAAAHGIEFVGLS